MIYMRVDGDDELTVQVEAVRKLINEATASVKDGVIVN